MFKKLLFIVLINSVCCEPLNSQQLKDVFGSQICIQASLSTIDFVNPDNLLLKQAENNFKTAIPNTTILERKTKDEKSVLSNLNELVQYNEIKYFFKLEKEEGPPHDKLFTISLTLGEEKYVSEGKSLKKAQQNAAILALENTKYVRPPIKDKSEDVASLTPTVLLNNLCMKLGLGVSYVLVDEEKQRVLQSNVVLDEKSKSYIQKLNKSIYDDRSLRSKKDLPQTKGPFRVKLEVGKYVFYGISHTIQSARHNAATNALDFLVQNKDDLESDCLNNEDSQQCQKTRTGLKSPVSLVYEAGQARNIDVEFEIIEESGPAHRKNFVTRCRLGELTTTGEGTSKKESKKAAAENMLGRIPELPAVSQEKQVMSMMKNKNKKKKKKKNKIIRSKFEEIGMVVEDIVGSVLGYGKEDKNDKTQVHSDDTDSNELHKKSKYLKKSYQDELLELSSFLNIEVNYLDFEEDKFFSLLSLKIDPEHLCFGQGYDKKEAREKAADGALNLLFTMGLYDHFDEKYQSQEMDTKEAVQSILHQEISDDS